MENNYELTEDRKNLIGISVKLVGHELKKLSYAEREIANILVKSGLLYVRESDKVLTFPELKF
jgi:hypothetical protein